MSDDYQKILEAVDSHLRNLEANGTRFLNVDLQTLAELGKPVLRAISFQPAVELPLRREEKKVLPQQNGSQINDGVSEEKTKITITTGDNVFKSVPATSQEKEVAMAALRERALACVKCPHLAGSRKNVVFGVGNIQTELMFVGEAPGADEDEQAEPFVGKAGELLTKIIQTMGFVRQSVYIANILKCRPDTPGQAYGNRKPTPDEMKTCLPYLLAQIDLIKPKVIVALGATAVEGLFGKAQIGITKQRGNWMTFRDTPVMPTYHPAYLLRKQALSEKRRVWEDMLQVMEKLGTPISEKQRNYFLKA